MPSRKSCFDIDTLNNKIQFFVIKRVGLKLCIFTTTKYGQKRSLSFHYTSQTFRLQNIWQRYLEIMQPRFHCLLYQNLEHNTEHNLHRVHLFKGIVGLVAIFRLLKFKKIQDNERHDLFCKRTRVLIREIICLNKTEYLKYRQAGIPQIRNPRSGSGTCPRYIHWYLFHSPGHIRVLVPCKNGCPLSGFGFCGMISVILKIFIQSYQITHINFQQYHFYYLISNATRNTVMLMTDGYFSCSSVGCNRGV